MIARITTNQTIHFDQITPVEESVLVDEFSVRHPRAHYIDTFEGNFDGWFRKYNATHRRMNRALLGELRRVCVKRNLPLDVVDERPPNKHPAPDPNSIGTDILPGIILEEYQMRGIRAACRAEVGLFQYITGSGKGELIAAITKIMNCPTVIIAEQAIVIKQLKERLELRQVVEEAGMFMAGKRPSGQTVIVGLIQSLAAPTKAPEKTKEDTAESFAKKLAAFKTRLKNSRWLKKVVGKCDMLLVDEADRATNKQYGMLCKVWFKGRRRYGFSGTFFDPETPVENLKLKENLGTIIAEAHRDEVQSAGRIVPVSYTSLVFGNPANRDERSAFDVAESTHITNNPKFHKLVCRLTEKYMTKPKYGVVILIDKVDLGRELEKLIPGSKFICGTTPKKQRDKVIALFEKREIRVLIGSKIIRRGLDLHGGCEVLINATGGKRWSEFMQLIGRAVRLNKLGIGYVYDFFFYDNTYLYDHSRKRLKHIIATGYNARVVFSHTTIDAVKFVKSRFRIPK